MSGLPKTLVNVSLEENMNIEQKPKRMALPDIFTTFPAIRTSDQQFLNFPIKENEVNSNEFDPNKKIINPYVFET